MSNGQPRPAFYVAVLLVVLGLVGLALWRYGAIGPKPSTGQFTADELAKMKTGAEAPDTSGITTVKEYNFVASARLPEVKGISSYTPMADRTVRFAINVWAGWSPIIYANNGFKPGKLWKTPGGKDFKIELVLIDDPIAMRDAYAAGNLHIGWATLDMLPLFLEGLRKDSRVMPRVYQQVDWSNGGDGIVVRENIKTMADLRGKTVVLAQNSPSHFFILNALINAGVQPSEVNFKFTQDAFQAAAAFNADKTISGVVSWAPDIYNLEKARGNRMLVTTSTANKLIADVWFARADFAKDNADIVEGITRGIFDAMIELKAQDAKQRVAKLMAAGYSIPESDTLGMLGDAHSTNYAENRDFFMNQNNPDQLRADVEHRLLPLQADQRGHAADAVRPGDGFLGDPEAGRRAEVLEPEERVRHPVRAGQRGRGSRREGRDSHQDRGDSFLPQLMGPEQEGDAECRGEGSGGALRSQRQLRGRGNRQARRAVRRRADRRRGTHRRVDEGVGAQKPGAGALAEPRQLREGGDPAQVPVAAAEPVLDRGHRMGSTGRHGGPGKQREEPPGRDQGVPGGSGAGRQVDGATPGTGRCSRSVCLRRA